MAIDGQIVPVIKTGQGVSDSSGVLDVVFDDPFSDSTYSISVMTGIFALCRVPIGSRTSGGFQVRTYDVSGGSLASVALTWTAISRIQ